MLRKKCRVYYNITFRRVNFKLNDNTVCEEKCKFCGSDFNNRYCKKVEIKDSVTLKDVCCGVDNWDNEMSTSYIPDQNLCY